LKKPERGKSGDVRSNVQTGTQKHQSNHLGLNNKDVFSKLDINFIDDTNIDFIGSSSSPRQKDVDFLDTPINNSGNRKSPEKNNVFFENLENVFIGQAETKTEEKSTSNSKSNKNILIIIK